MTRRLLLLALVLAGLAGGCGGGDDGETTAATTGSATAAATEAGTTGASEAGCREVEAPKPKPDGGQEAPTESLDPNTSYRLVFETSCGSFTVELDQAAAPKTAASLVSLAEDGFFDGTTFHRVVPGFVIQGGDPTATGTGGPGYSTVDAPPQDASYTQGAVAMAKTGAEAPGTAGSQFFVVTGADAGLPPDYAIVGTVSEGLDTVLAIDALGTGDGPPSQPVVIDRVTVESG
jgi:peptidyl-prolyl cis-trans isomerase B (cyclophilin B)